MKDMTNTNLQDTAPQEKATPRAQRWLLRVRGPALIDIEDGEGRHIGPIGEDGSGARRHFSQEAGDFIIRRGKEDKKEEQAQDKRCIRQIPDFPNLFEVSIPGVIYNPGRTYSWVSIGHPGIYRFRLLGRTACTVDIYWTAFSDTTRLNTTYFHAIPMTAGDLVSFRYNTAHPSIFTVTYSNSMGNERKEIAHTAVLSPAESRDETRPTTNIAVTGREALVTATDDPGHEALDDRGSGILHTLYTTDLHTFSTHIPPFSALIPPEASIVMAFSIDRNGNREYPGAVKPVLGLSQTRFVFNTTEGDQRTVSQRLKIVNRDPVPLTGPIDWVVSGDLISTWLLVESREGKTPGAVTISVNSSGLKPDAYKGTLMISSPSPGVVFAQQTVEVELHVEAGPGSSEVIKNAV